jgi:hypothetical protein
MYTSRQHSATLSSVRTYEYSTDSDSNAVSDTAKYAVDNATNTTNTTYTTDASNPTVSFELIRTMFS